MFACGNLILSERSACYIMTIGVIDECRKLGLGTQMIHYTIDFVEKNFPECTNIWLHVVDYNVSAIKFYLKNNFTKFRKLKRHYYIDRKEYDAIVLYKALGKFKKEKLDIE